MNEETTSANSATLETLEGDYAKLVQAEQKVGSLWKKLGADLEKVRNEIEAREVVVKEQLKATYKKLAGGKK